MGYMKRDGRPQDGRRSKLLQVRIAPADYAAIQQASSHMGMTVSEYVRCVAAELAGQHMNPVYLYRPGVGERSIRHYNWAVGGIYYPAGAVHPAEGAVHPAEGEGAMGYMKRDGRPQDGRRSKLLQVRIAPADYAVIQQASSHEGMTVSEYLRSVVIGSVHDGRQHSDPLESAPIT